MTSEIKKTLNQECSSQMFKKSSSQDSLTEIVHGYVRRILDGVSTPPRGQENSLKKPLSAPPSQNSSFDDLEKLFWGESSTAKHSSKSSSMYVSPNYSIRNSPVDNQLSVAHLLSIFEKMVALSKDRPG